MLLIAHTHTHTVALRSMYTQAHALYAHEAGLSNSSSSPRSTRLLLLRQIRSRVEHKASSILCQVRCRCRKEDAPPSPLPPRTLLLHVCCCCCCYFGCCASRPALYLITEISINKRASRAGGTTAREARRATIERYILPTYMALSGEGEGGGWAEGAWHLAYLRQLNFACAAREGGHDEPRRKPASRLALNCTPSRSCSRSQSHSPFPNAHVSLCLRLRLRLSLNLRSVSKREKLN